MTICEWVSCCKTKVVWLPAKDMRGSSLRYEGAGGRANYVVPEMEQIQTTSISRFFQYYT